MAALLEHTAGLSDRARAVLARVQEGVLGHDEVERLGRLAGVGEGALAADVDQVLQALLLGELGVAVVLLINILSINIIHELETDLYGPPFKPDKTSIQMALF